MNYAVIDTETTGLFDFTKPADAEGQPRLANLGIVMLNEDLTVQAEHDLLVKPDGWTVDPEALAVNGLTAERLERDGVPIDQVLRKYTTLIEAGYVIVSFNAQFDCKVMRGELRRAKMPDLFEQTKNICIMRTLTGVCRIPKKNGAGYKFPKLSEACAHFKLSQPAAHSALGDAHSAAALLRVAKAIGVLPEPEVHYAKTAPAKPAKPEPEKPAAAVKYKQGDRITQNGVELEHNGLQFVPVMNAANYPARFEKDGSPKL